MFRTKSQTKLFLCLIAIIAFSAARDNARLAAYGQSISGTPSVRLPVLSFILDGTHQLRPLNGVPGSASVGAPVDLGIEMIHAAIPSSHDYILAMTNDNGWPRLIQVRGESLYLYPSDVDERTTIDRVALSPSGSAAAFFSSSQQRVYVFTNLAQTPALAAKLDIAQAGSVTALAVSDDAKTVAVGISDGTAGALLFLNSGRRPRHVGAMRHPSAIAFLHGSDSAIVADDIDNAVYAVSGGQPFIVASTERGISKPTDIAVSKDNRRIFVADSSAGSVTVIGPNGTVAEPQHCNCTLTGLRPTSADSVFTLTDFSGGPVVLFDGSGAVPRMTFAPVRR
jgi:DNA-binding beta-propeller fold protein YncE